MQKPKRLSGGAQLVASGKKPMTLGFTPDEFEAIKSATASEGLRHMSEFARQAILKAARKAAKV